MELFVRNTTVFFKSLFSFDLVVHERWYRLESKQENILSIDSRQVESSKQLLFPKMDNFVSSISKGSGCIHPEISSFMLWKNERCWPETDLICYGITIHWLWNCNNDNKSYHFLIACCVRGMMVHGLAYAKLTTSHEGWFYCVPNLWTVWVLQVLYKHKLLLLTTQIL